MTTGQVADRAGVNIQTVRYYERRGLLPAPPRRASGYRQYGSDHVSRIRFIKRAQELGFTLEEIDELLSLRADPDADSSEVLERALRKIEDIDRKMQDLSRMRATLEDLTHACAGHGSTDNCPILAALEVES